MSTNPNDTQNEPNDSTEKLTQLYTHKLKRLQRIDKILESRFELALKKNGYDKRAQRIELAWNLMASRICKVYRKRYEIER